MSQQYHVEITAEHRIRARLLLAKEYPEGAPDWHVEEVARCLAEEASYYE